MKSVAAAPGGAILDPQQATTVQADPDVPVTYIPGQGWDFADNGEEG